MENAISRPECYGLKTRTERHGRKPRTERHGMKPPTERHGRKPRTERHGLKPPTERHGWKPRTERHGRKPPTERHGRKPPTERHGWKPRTERHGRKPPTERHGLKSRTERHGLKPEATYTLPLRGGSAFRFGAVLAGDMAKVASDFIPWLASTRSGSESRRSTRSGSTRCGSASCRSTWGGSMFPSRTERHGLKPEATYALPLRGGSAFRFRAVPAGDKAKVASEFIPWLASTRCESASRRSTRCGSTRSGSTRCESASRRSTWRGSMFPSRTERHGLKPEATPVLPLRGGSAFRFRAVPAGDKAKVASEFIPWLAKVASESIPWLASTRCESAPCQSGGTNRRGTDRHGAVLSSRRGRRPES